MSRHIGVDYSQIELRVAHFLNNQQPVVGEDIHARVASQINGVQLPEVTPEMRRKAKAVNFGAIYGQSPFGLTKEVI